MTLYTKKLIYAALVTCMLMAGTAAHAITPGGNFKRVTFAGASQLTIDNRGTTVVLRFTGKLKESSEAIKAQLAGYATEATLSANGRELTLTMVKPYRIRQFKSSGGAGIDVVGAADPKAAAAAKANAAKIVVPKPEALLTTKPEKSPMTAVEKPAQKSIEKPVEKPVEKLVEKPVEQAAPPPPVAKPAAVVSAAPAADPMLSTKKEEAPPIPEPKKEVAAPEFSTKHPEVPAAPKPDDDVLDTNAPTIVTRPESAVAKEAQAKPGADEKTIPAPLSKAGDEKGAALTPPKEETAGGDKKEPAEPQVATHAPNEPLVVSARNSSGGTVINFPWRDRTAAAVFERSRDIWIVFSRPADIQVPLLRTVLPKPVVDITQYNYAGNTVLRLITDGSVHASASLAKGSYDWNVTLSTAITPPKLDVSVTADTTYGTRQLLLGAFDVSEALRFYDPHVGDLLMVIPSYESGRGVLHERNFPEFTMLNTNQGITIVSARADIGNQTSRAGVALYTDGGLAISENLPVLTSGDAPVPGISTPSDVMLPYDQWYVPQSQFYDTLHQRLDALVNASPASKPDSLFALVTLYLGDGHGAEAHGYLSIIQQQFPDYYTSHKLALLHAVAYVLLNDIPNAARELDAPELTGLAEADLWREVVGLYAPVASTAQKLQQAVEKPEATPESGPVTLATKKKEDKTPDLKLSYTPTMTVPKSVLRFLKYNRPYIHFYPPRIRQHLARIAAEAYIQNDELDKALAVFDTLSHDGIGGPLKLNAEYTLALIAIQKKHPEQALDMLNELSTQNDDLYIKACARYTAIMLHYNQGDITANDTVEALENLRFSWRGDALERKILDSLARLYQNDNRYDNLLRTWKAILEGFPNDPDFLGIAGNMGELFTNLYLRGQADAMTPLKSLSLFYEFRDLTPVGQDGDEIIRRLADRLAAFDLLDRATQLLENQIKFRLSNEERSRVGARLALLHVLNHEPQEALQVLQVTNYGSNPVDLARQRLQLTAEALSSLGKHEEALSMLTNDNSREGALLRLDILWAMQDWPNVVNRAEDLLAERHNLTAPLTPEETEVLLKLAIGYSFQGDNMQLRYLHDYYMGLIPDTAYKQIFDFITNDTTPLDPADVSMLTQQISNTESFLTLFKAKIAAGKLSETIK